MNQDGHLVVEKATILAIRAHSGQMRKDAPTPYIAHPIRVALLLARYGFSDTVIAAGLLHDVVEDTSVSLEEIKDEFGNEIAELVKSVSNDDTLGWEEKKKKYIETLRGAPDNSKAIATADKIANAESLLAARAREGSAVWSHFNAPREKKLWFEESVLEMLLEKWPCPMVEEYARLVVALKGLD